MTSLASTAFANRRTDFRSFSTTRGVSWRRVADPCSSPFKVGPLNCLRAGVEGANRKLDRAQLLTGSQLCSLYLSQGAHVHSPTSLASTAVANRRTDVRSFSTTRGADLCSSPFKANRSVRSTATSARNDHSHVRLTGRPVAKLTGRPAVRTMPCGVPQTFW